MTLAGHGLPQRLQILDELWVGFVHGLFQLQEQVRRPGSCEIRSRGEHSHDKHSNFFLFLFPSVSFGGRMLPCCRGAVSLFFLSKIMFNSFFHWKLQSEPKRHVFEPRRLYTRQFFFSQLKQPKALCWCGINWLSPRKSASSREPAAQCRKVKQQ